MTMVVKGGANSDTLQNERKHENSSLFFFFFTSHFSSEDELRHFIRNYRAWHFIFAKNYAKISAHQ